MRTRQYDNPVFQIKSYIDALERFADSAGDLSREDRDQLSTLLDQGDHIRGAIEQLGEDAERYRYLKTAEAGSLGWSDGWLDAGDTDKWDDLIDRALHTPG